MGKHYTAAEIDTMYRLFEARKPLSEMAETLGRDSNAVFMKLTKLRCADRDKWDSDTFSFYGSQYYHANVNDRRRKDDKHKMHRRFIYGIISGERRVGYEMGGIVQSNGSIEVRLIRDTITEDNFDMSIAERDFDMQIKEALGRANISHLNDKIDLRHEGKNISVSFEYGCLGQRDSLIAKHFIQAYAQLLEKERNAQMVDEAAMPLECAGVS